MKRSRRKGTPQVSSPAAIAAPRPRISWWQPLLIVVVGLIAYANGLSGPFIFDDRATVLDNKQIENLSNLGQVLSPPHETPVAGRPIVNLTLAINYALGGRNVFGYHVVNVGLHILCALMAYFVIGQMIARARRSVAVGDRHLFPLLVAILWLVHPLNTEVVNYISQRTESLMALFYLMTIYAALRATASRRRGAWEFAAVAACALGMASKESMVTAPVMVVLFDRIFLYNFSGGWARAFADRKRLYAGLAASWVVLAGLLWSSPRALSAGFSAHDAAVGTYLLNQAVMVTRYLWLSIWPRSLVVYYGYPLPLAFADVWPYVLGLGVLGALAIVALLRKPTLGFLGAWVIVTLAPTSSIVPISTEVGAERRMYLPLLALVALAVLALRGRTSDPQEMGAIRRFFDSRVARYVPVAVALALVAGTMARNREYQSSLTLAQTSAARWPSPGTQSMLGTELASAGRYAEAEKQLRLAEPTFVPARYFLGALLAAQGRTDEAVAKLQEFVRDEPPALTQVRDARELLADIFSKSQRLPEAVEQYRQMISTEPEDLEAHAMLAASLVKLRDYAGAVPHYQAVLASQPDDLRALNGLGVAMASLNRLEEALAAFRRVEALDPENANARENVRRIVALIAQQQHDHQQ